MEHTKNYQPNVQVNMRHGSVFEALKYKWKELTLTAGLLVFGLLFGINHIYMSPNYIEGFQTLVDNVFFVVPVALGVLGTAGFGVYAGTHLSTLQDSKK